MVLADRALRTKTSWKQLGDHHHAWTVESAVPLRVGLIGRHSARGKKELVRGLQQLGGSWRRVLEIELILVGV